MRIAVLLFDRVTALDAVGPYEVLSRLPNVRVDFVADKVRLVPADTGFLSLQATAAYDDLGAPDVLVVPGGPGQHDHMDDQVLLAWLRQASAAASWTTSVCTGSLLLGAAGLLEGKRATTHWLAVDQLKRHGARPEPGRVVVDGNTMTAAGVSAGLDMALALAGRIAGARTAQAIQLGIEYDPHPPYAAGSPATAPLAIVQLLRLRRKRVLRG